MRLSLPRLRRTQPGDKTSAIDRNGRGDQQSPRRRSPGTPQPPRSRARFRTWLTSLPQCTKRKRSGESLIGRYSGRARARVEPARSNRTALLNPLLCSPYSRAQKPQSRPLGRRAGSGAVGARGCDGCPCRGHAFRHAKADAAIAAGHDRDAPRAVEDLHRASFRIMSDPFSPIMTIAALVLPDTTAGMIEPSTTRKPSTPCTFRRASTTARGSLPIRQEQLG